MPVSRLFCPTLTEGAVRLSSEESHHAIAVLRVKIGAEVILFDGAGTEAVGHVQRIDRRQLEVNVGRLMRQPFELTHRLTLAVAMPKTHRQGYLIEKCTELGVAAIWPISTARAVTKPGRAAVERWQRRAIEAAKQSRRSWVPHVTAPRSFDESIEHAGDFDAAGITERDASAIPFPTFLAGQSESSSVLVWVGPEGGWTDDERNRAIAAGAIPTGLGPGVLRTETAAVAVCAAAALLSPGKPDGQRNHSGGTD